MNGAIGEPLPASAPRHPARLLLTGLRPTARWAFRRYVGVRVHGAERVPTTGPVLVTGNHASALDGPLMAAYTPRPVHALTKQEMFSGPVGAALRAVGQIRLDRMHPDPAAVKTVLRVLRDGHVAGIFPEGTRGAGDWLGPFHRGAAYLALVTGAPVVPVTFLGTAPASGSSLPPRGAKVEMVFGEPWQVEQRAWPRTREQVEHSSLLLQQYLRAEYERAIDLTGMAPLGDATHHSRGGTRTARDLEPHTEEHHE